MDLATQIAHETDMRNRGIERFRKQHNDAALRGEFAETSTGMAFQDHIEMAVAAKLEAFVAEAKSGRPGTRRSAALMVGDLDVATVAYLTTRVILNTIPLTSAAQGANGVTKCTTTFVAFAIAMACHDEVAMRYFASNRKALLQAIIKDFDKKEMPRRRRRELIQKTMDRQGLDWKAKGWGDKARLNFGIAMLDVFLQSTGCVRIEEVRKGTKGHRKLVTPTPDALEAIAKRMDANEDGHAVYLPTLIPPKPWTQDNLYGGGYYTDAVTKYPFIKGANRTYLEELENSDLSIPIAAINAIQDTAWKVDPWMLNVARWAFEHHAVRSGLPAPSAVDIPEKPPLADTDEEVSKEYRKACYMTHEYNRRNISKRILALQAFHIAGEMVEHERIYFPHWLDSRGRAYPKPVILNPQGTDYIRSILTFADGKAIRTGTPEADWLLIATANAFGEDKLDLQSRVDWAMENQDMILSIGEDPYSDHRWMDASEPFGFLRMCREVYELAVAESEGRVYVSHAPIPVDATCSGLQHFSAMLKDEVGGTAVNLRNLPERRDVYLEVAERVKVRMLEATKGSDEAVAGMAQAALDAGIARGLTKRPVMIVPYSGTLHACIKYVGDYYSEEGLTPYEPMGPFVTFVAMEVWAAIADTVIAARGAMDWMRDLTSTVVKEGHNVPLVWTTPAGLPVRQIRFEELPVRVFTYLDGSRTAIQFRRESRKVSKAKMLSSVAPNFVHSMDAAHLQMSVYASEDAYANGDFPTPLSYAMIHDSFGVHAADMPNFGIILRASFHHMYANNDVLADLHADAAAILDDPSALAPVPEKGTLDLDEVINSDFFFS